ncbi:hypothetical protein QJ856_gp0216 [Tupanvirus deep ocean]|uniref:Uncharacterized protein n=2 Tax=Tupanvirus TaxID=2094720 RepID=A0AC62AA39_9VIRU|nr:hypothetical protein QJ856_gp0216 [Tupanvirus deep ocean]QKU34513.1 hypothetical protein [Tupanvirus deep ocean]
MIRIIYYYNIIQVNKKNNNLNLTYIANFGNILLVQIYIVMKIRKFLFKFIDHENEQIIEVEFDIHSSRVSEWTQNEDDVEGFGQWMGRHARWEMLLKNEVKRLVRQKYFADANDFGDYRLSKQYIRKEIKNVNMSEAATDELHFRQARLMEKYITKYIRGTKPQKRGYIYNYDKTHEHYNYFLNDDMDQSINLRELTCEGNKIVIPQDKNNRNSTTKENSQKSRSRNLMNVRDTTNTANTVTNNNRASTVANTNRNVDLTPYTVTGTPGYNNTSTINANANRISATTNNTMATGNRTATNNTIATNNTTTTGNRTATNNRNATGLGVTPSRTNANAATTVTTGLGMTAADLRPTGTTFGSNAIAARNTTGTTGATTTNQRGGEDYQDKYMKYKKKYVDLKKNRH